MDYLPSSDINKFLGILKKVLGYGYQIHPEALKILESLNEEKAFEVLDSFPEKFPEAIVIEVKHVERILVKSAVKKATKTREFGSKLIGKITQIYDGSGLIQRCPKCNRWIIDNFCMVHSDVEGVWDLRIKARFDDGKERCTLIFKKDITEKSANITLKEARKLGEAATLERVKNALVGKNIEIEGVKLNGNFLVKDIREV
jgi:ssDNA-binding replication factor A large subunit